MQKLPQNKSIIIFILLADIVISISEYTIELGTPKEDRKSAAFASVAAFIAGFFIFPLVLSLLYTLHIIKYSIKNCARKTTKLSLLALDLVGAMFYLYGDNIKGLLDTYAQELGCDNKCRRLNRIFIALALGIALLVQHVLTPLSQKIVKMIPQKNTGMTKVENGWHHALDMVAIFYKVDILYTTILNRAGTREICDTFTNSLNVAFAAMFTTVAVFAVITNARYAWTKIQHKRKTVYIVIMSAALITSLPMFLLGDNGQPLDCAFKCDNSDFDEFDDYYAENDTGTSSAQDCSSKRVNIKVKLVFMIFTFIAVLSVFVSLLILKGKPKTSKVKEAATITTNLADA